MAANDRRGAGDLSRGQIGAVFKPVRKVSDMQCVHIIKPDLRNLIPDSRPRLVVLARERLTVAGAGNHQPVVLIQFPLDLAAGDRAGSSRLRLCCNFFVESTVIDRMHVRLCRECGHGQGKQHTQSQHKCGEFLKILHHAASLSVTAAIVKITIAALTLVTASLADTFAL